MEYITKKTVLVLFLFNVSLELNNLFLNEDTIAQLRTLFFIPVLHLGLSSEYQNILKQVGHVYLCPITTYMVFIITLLTKILKGTQEEEKATF